MLSQIFEFDGYSVISATSKDCSRLRPGNGGIRIGQYQDNSVAEAEALRLASVMELKHSFARTGMSGAKVVVNAEPNTCKQDVMKSIGTEVLGDGSLYLGCDMGTDGDDMDTLMQHSKYVLASRGSLVDPNWATAESTFGCIQAVLGDHLDRYTFLVEGVGKVGSHIARLLMKYKAKEVICKDVDEAREHVRSFADDAPRFTKSVSRDFESTEAAMSAVDVFVPCASCGTVNSVILDALKNCKVIAGPANAAVASILDFKKVLDRDITLIPDYMTGTGAIQVDVLEYAGFLPEVPPDVVYAWVRSQSKHRCAVVLEKFRKQILCDMSVSTSILEECIDSDPVLRVSAKTSFLEFEQRMHEECEIPIVGGGITGSATDYSACVPALATGLSAPMDIRKFQMAKYIKPSDAPVPNLSALSKL